MLVLCNICRTCSAQCKCKIKRQKAKFGTVMSCLGAQSWAGIIVVERSWSGLAIQPTQAPESRHPARCVAQDLFLPIHIHNGPQPGSGMHAKASWSFQNSVGFSTLTCLQRAWDNIHPRFFVSRCSLHESWKEKEYTQGHGGACLLPQVGSDGVKEVGKPLTRWAELP